MGSFFLDDKGNIGRLFEEHSILGFVNTYWHFSLVEDEDFINLCKEYMIFFKMSPSLQMLDHGALVNSFLHRKNQLKP